MCETSIDMAGDDRALGVEVEAPRTEHRHRAFEHAPELDDLAGLHELHRRKHRCRLHVVGRSARVAGAPRSWKK